MGGLGNLDECFQMGAWLGPVLSGLKQVSSQHIYPG